MGSLEVIERLSEVMLWRGIPEHIRSDNGPEFVARKLRQWLGKSGHGEPVHRARQPLGERILREF